MAEPPAKKKRGAKGDDVSQQLKKRIAKVGSAKDVLCGPADLPAEKLRLRRRRARTRCFRRSRSWWIS